MNRWLRMNVSTAGRRCLVDWRKKPFSLRIAIILLFCPIVYSLFGIMLKQMLLLYRRPFNVSLRLSYITSLFNNAELQGAPVRLWFFPLSSIFRTFSWSIGYSKHGIKMASDTTSFCWFRTVEVCWYVSAYSRRRWVYMVYYTTILNGTKPPRNAIVTGKELRRIGQNVVVLSCVLSFEMHHNFEPWSSPVKLEEFHFNTDLLSTAHLLNAYCWACWPDAAVWRWQCRSGCYTKPAAAVPVVHPVFWGANGICVNGAFLPLGAGERNGLSTYPMLHDYVEVLFYQHEQHQNEDGVCLTVRSAVLKLTAFFCEWCPSCTRTTNRQSTWVPSRSIGQPIHAHYTARSDDLFRAKGGYFKDPSIGQRVESGQANSVVNQEAS
jgi:hypothetical protein